MITNPFTGEILENHKGGHGKKGFAGLGTKTAPMVTTGNFQDPGSPSATGKIPSRHKAQEMNHVRGLWDAKTQGLILYDMKDEVQAISSLAGRPTSVIEKVLDRNMDKAFRNSFFAGRKKTDPISERGALAIGG